MLTKNINKTKENETIIPIYYIDNYKQDNIKKIIQEYKFNNVFYSKYLLNTLIDICIYQIIKNKDKNILFTHPPSTMYYKKEKDIDSMENLMKLTSIYINDYFDTKSIEKKLYFKNIFSFNIKNLKNTEVQHLQKNRKSRLLNNNKFKVKIKYKKYIQKSKIIIIDDISTTGATLYTCQKSLNKLFSDLDIELFSIAH